MEFNYYYGCQADQFSFIRIPKVMLTEETFSDLSIQAKVLYGVLLDRMTLSRKNGWFDEENRVFIIYQIGEIQADLGFSKKKAMDLLSELESFGLLEKKRRGHGLPNILYVKSFMTGIDSAAASVKGKEEDKLGDRSAETGTSWEKKDESRSAGADTLRGADFSTSRVSFSTPLEVQNPAPLKNNTEENNNYRSDIESNHILSGGIDEIRSDETMISEAEAYEQIICENIGYEDLLITHPYDQELIKGIAALILETVLTKNDTIVIASNRYPAAVVKARFLKLNYSHIDYVLSCLKKNTSRINNIRKYLLAALFNAPSTMSGYYQAAVNHDMSEMADRMV